MDRDLHAAALLSPRQLAAYNRKPPDKIGNIASLSSTQIAALGFPSAIEQTGTGDEQPPVVGGRRARRNAINTGSGTRDRAEFESTSPTNSPARAGFTLTSAPCTNSTFPDGQPSRKIPARRHLACDSHLPTVLRAGRLELQVGASDVFGNYRLYLPAELNQIVPELHDGPPVAPSISGVTPAFAASAGGSEATINGSEFEEVEGVKFGTKTAATFKVNSSSSITATAPEGSGTVDVRVITSGGKSATVNADHRPT